MNESQPPVLNEKSTVSCFTKFAANFSIFAPLIAFFVFFICVYGHIGLNIISIVGLLPLLVIFAGLIIGIVSLVTAKQCMSIFVKAIIGTLLNGFLLFAFIALPFFLPPMIGHKYPTTPQGRLDKRQKNWRRLQLMKINFTHWMAQLKKVSMWGKFKTSKIMLMNY
jgi:hypothetical protein